MSAEDDKNECSGSEPEIEDDDDDEMPVYEEKVKPKAPPRKNKAIPTPEEQLSTNMKLTVREICSGDDKKDAAECEQIWRAKIAEEDEKSIDDAVKSMMNEKLRFMAVAGHPHKMEWLLNKGADINSIDPGTGNTALLNAFAVTAHLDAQKEVISLLMERGCDAMIKNKVGHTAKTTVAGQCDELCNLVRQLDVQRTKK